MRAFASFQGSYAIMASTAITFLCIGAFYLINSGRAPLSVAPRPSDSASVFYALDEIHQSIIAARHERILRLVDNDGVTLHSSRLTAFQFKDSLDRILAKATQGDELRFLSLRDVQINLMGATESVVSFRIPFDSAGRRKTMKFLKQRDSWRISDATGLIEGIGLYGSSNRVNERTSESSPSHSSAISMAIPQQVFESQRALIPKPFADTPVLWKITMTLAQQEFGNRLMANADDGEVVPLPGDEVAFILDKGWQRILFGRTSTARIRSYGDKPGEFDFLAPTALKALRFPDGKIAVFVTDAALSCVVHLIYDPLLDQISHFRTLTAGLIKPIDVEIDAQGAQATWPNYNIWIADTGSGAVLRLNKDGVVTHTLSSYSFPLGGPTFPLRIPRRISVEDDEPGYGSLYLIDGDDNSLVHLTMYNQQPYSYANARTNFGSSSNMTAMGSIWSGIVAVSDTGLNRMHLFQNSEYLCSFSSFNSSGSVYPTYFTQVNGTQLLKLPGLISHYNANPSNTILDAFVGNLWAPNEGFIRMLPGADITDFRVSFPAGGIQFDYRLTNKSIYSAKIHDQNNVVVWDFNQGSTIAGPGYRINAVQWASLPPGAHTFRLSVLPQSNSSYGSMAQSPVQMNQSFSTPLNVSMSGPSTVYHADPKTTPPNCYNWGAVISGGMPPYTHTWTGFLSGSTSTVSSCFSWNGYGGGSYQLTLRVDVTDASSPPKSAFATKTITAFNSGGGPIAETGGDDAAELIPTEFTIGQNYPNPFNPDTEILFGVPENARVLVKIHDLTGRTVVTLDEKEYSPGFHRIKWAGRDQDGKEVSTGVYFCRVVMIGASGKEFSKVIKMALTK